VSGCIKKSHSDRIEDNTGNKVIRYEALLELTIPLKTSSVVKIGYICEEN
jgi:hypothetical protein